MKDVIDTNGHRIGLKDEGEGLNSIGKDKVLRAMGEYMGSKILAPQEFL